LREVDLFPTHSLELTLKGLVLFECFTPCSQVAMVSSLTDLCF
jgi:hypothetical protein